MKHLLNIIINFIDKKILKGKLPKMDISDAEMESNMQEYIDNVGKERDVEPYCVPTKEHIEMMKKYLEGGKDE